MTPILLITGGSSGIGAATAMLAAEQGYERVVLTYREDSDGADRVTKALIDQGINAHAVQSDVTNPDSTAQLFEFLRGLPRGPLHLVNNAGTVSPQGSIADLTPDRVEKVFAVNVFGAIEVVRQAVAFMRDNQGGHIVNISSAAARLGSANLFVDYAASKGAIDTFTLGLADELAAEGIRVNAIRPGLIETAIHAKGGIPDRLEQIGHTPPMGRPGSAAEVAQGILWLLSDKASYVTRSILDIAGGR